MIKLHFPKSQNLREKFRYIFHVGWHIHLGRQLRVKSHVEPALPATDVHATFWVGRILAISSWDRRDAYRHVEAVHEAHIVPRVKDTVVRTRASAGLGKYFHHVLTHLHYFNVFIVRDYVIGVIFAYGMYIILIRTFTNFLVARARTS